MYRLFLVAVFALGLGHLKAQEYFPNNTAVKSDAEIPIAFIGSTIHTAPGKIIKDANLLIHKGKIMAVGRDIDIPEGARSVDLSGYHLYASFIDLYTDFGISDIPKAKSSGKPQYDPVRKGHYWNDHIRPEQSATDFYSFDEKKADILRQQGFGIVQTHVQDGVIRGTGMVVGLVDTESAILKDRSAQFSGFSRSQQSRQSYPNSIMGYTALLRQVQHDLNAYQKGLIDRKDLSLEALERNRQLPQIFEAKSLLNILRAAEVASTTEQDFIYVSGGDEYQRLDQIAALKAKFIVPLDFPQTYDVENPYLAQHLSLGDMKHWEHAPSNPKWLADRKVPFALSTTQLEKTSSFRQQLQIAIDRGLNPETALAALTTLPAQWLGLENEIGRIQKGARANFFITDGPIFNKESDIYEHWILGHPHVFKLRDQISLAGQYRLNFGKDSLSLQLKEKNGKYSGKLKQDSLQLGLKVSFDEGWLYMTASTADTASLGFTRFRARVHSPDTITGVAFTSDNRKLPFTASKVSPEEPDEKEKNNDEEEEEKEDETQDSDLGPIIYPNMAFGQSNPTIKKGNLLITEATVITGEDTGTLENTDVWIKNGRIEKIGQNLEVENITTIDGKGKFLTAGIIDEHSHIAGSSINESGQNSSAQVRMSDAVNPNDISIYRALAGGVTSIQLLHGSANPIGGQSAILKLKWGGTAKDLLYDNMPKFIKFALGENVKQSNWGGSSRFPQSRMGVEQLFVDYFSRARTYGTLKKSGQAYRVDEELETLLEIIESKRFISCHSYIQSEINMLMKVAESFNFTLNTFTHILEGYKVADKMKEHGAGGSSFSDWWAYKFEVKDAIPYNAALMHEQGVTVAINSDDGEMIRRLNQEAAKSIKYGGVSEEDAWKFVTLNPAKLLHIDDRVGSLKEGKDGDVVLWSHHPLSVYAIAETTVIEGQIYFDRERDKNLREKVERERTRLIEKMLREKNKGVKTQVIEKEEKKHFCCDTIDEY
jgi:imidazolonepropionase-like amidohydrolase